MRNALIVVLMLLASVVAAQNCVEIELDGKGATSITSTLNHDFGSGFGAFAFLQDTRGWSQAYAGPTYSPCSEIQLGVGLGLESDTDEIRKGGFLWAGKGDFSFLGLYEEGGSGPWHKHWLMYNVDKKWSVGLVDRSFYGEGVVITRSLGSNDSLKVEGYRSTLTAAWKHSF